jgi:hypothetical protein
MEIVRQIIDIYRSYFIGLQSKVAQLRAHREQPPG